MMSTELTMECNDCCFRRKLAQQIEREKEKQPLAKESLRDNGRAGEQNQTQVTEGKKGDCCALCCRDESGCIANKQIQI